MQVEYNGERMKPGELTKKLEEPCRPRCRVCGCDIKRGPELCPACDLPYEAAMDDVVEWLRAQSPTRSASQLALDIECGDADGFAAKAKAALDGGK